MADGSFVISSPRFKEGSGKHGLNMKLSAFCVSEAMPMPRRNHYRLTA
jgi:hypothetical protein